MEGNKEQVQCQIFIWTFIEDPKYVKGLSLEFWSENVEEILPLTVCVLLQRDKSHGMILYPRWVIKFYRSAPHVGESCHLLSEVLSLDAPGHKQLRFYVDAARGREV